MASLIRRIEKRLMKAAGLKRFTSPVPGKFDSRGKQVVVSVVADKEANVYGNRYPSLIPRKFMTPARGADLDARLAREEKRRNA